MTTIKETRTGKVGGPIIEGEHYHMRYSVRGTGRTAPTTSHIVRSATLKTLCGRNAADWNRVVWHQPDCLKCRNLIPKE